MKAYHYQIFNVLTLETIDEGIIRDEEDNIYPAQNTGNNNLPYECEAHKFKADGYVLKGFYFNIDHDDLLKYKI